MTLSIGITGTRRGLINPQRAGLVGLIRESAMSEFHHGDCIGVDAEAHDLVRQLQPDVHIIVHPPMNPKNRAFKQGLILPEKDYFIRNIDIIKSCDILLACPKMLSEEQRSGTWHAIRYAAKIKRRTIIVWPTGKIEDRR